MDCFKVILDENQKFGIVDTFRIGQKNENSRPRPLKVKLRSQKERDLLLSYRPQFRKHFRTLDFQKHFSVTERQKHRDLMKQLLQRRQDGKLNFRIKNGAIEEIVLPQNRKPLIVWGCNQASQPQKTNAN